MRPSSLLAAIPLLLTTTAARADDPAPAKAADPAKPAKSWAIDVGAGTQFPISAGGMFTAELPYRILVQLDVGFMPKPYAYTIDGFLKAISVYDDTVSAIIRAALGNSFAMRAAAGWRPFPKHGFEATIGYTLVALGGSLGARDVINVLLEEKGSTRTIDADAGNEIPLHATLHGFQAQLGWRWLFLDDRLVLRANLSYLQILTSSFSVDISKSRRGGALEGAINREITGYLNPYFQTYAKAPVAGLSLAYRF